ncbi:MAG: DedA family protein [Bacteroidales bacterium]|nr:DedA family protein [Bacteroidales bacterium]
MALESSFIPFPSEIVVPPAAYAACNPESPLYTTDEKWLNILLVVVFATLGALIGALINYAISYFLGRPFVYWFAETKVGHLLMLNAEKVKKAEDYFIEHGNSSTLVGRLIPVIRQLISIPAGLSKMRILPFVIYTTLGAMAWNILLALLGYIAHGQQDLIAEYSHELSWILLALGVLFVGYLVFKALRKKRNQPKEKA